MSNRLKTPLAVLGASAALFGAQGCGGETDYAVIDETVHVGVNCSGEDNGIVMTGDEIMPATGTTPNGSPDKSSFRLRFYCNSGEMSMTEIPESSSPEILTASDNIVTFKTEDKVGERKVEELFTDRVVGKASAQTIELNVIKGSNYGDIELHNADTLISVTQQQPGEAVRAVSVDQIREDQDS